MKTESYFIFLLLTHCSRFVFSRIAPNYDNPKRALNQTLVLVYGNETLTLTLFDQFIENETDIMDNEVEKTRSKRQSGAGKFPEAAKMGQMKLFKLWLQMLRNPFVSAYVGAPHPFHPEAPKAVVFLAKQRVTQIFFPEVGVPDKTQ